VSTKIEAKPPLNPEQEERVARAFEKLGNPQLMELPTLHVPSPRIWYTITRTDLRRQPTATVDSLEGAIKLLIDGPFGSFRIERADGKVAVGDRDRGGLTVRFYDD
jgi:hypothetical protein